MKKYLPILLFTILNFWGYAQLSKGGEPRSLSVSLHQEVPTATLAALNTLQLQLEDAENAKNGVLERSAVIRPVSYNLNNAGSWTTLPNGDRIWRFVIHAEEAKAITLHYEDFYLPSGAEFFVYRPDYQQILGAYTSENNAANGNFVTELVFGDKVVLEYYEPANQKDNGSIGIRAVSHFYKDVPTEINVNGFGDSDNCQVNVNCTEGNAWQDEKKGVARIYVVAGWSGGWCTGSLVNNTNQDCSALFLTAFHCGEDSDPADFDDYIFYFNYESAGCSNGSESSILGSANYFSMTGCSVVSGSNNGGSSSSDFLLVEFNNIIPSDKDVYYNGWNRSLITNATANGVSIHHPSGDIKKISTYTQTLNTTGWNGSGLPSHYRVYWDATTNGHGVTEGGSSGSPIFNDQGQIIGTLTGGGSYCVATNSPDYYGKMSYHWNSNGTATNRRLDIHLDPAGGGSAVSLGGVYHPCTSNVNRDAGISSIIEPSDDICGSSFTPQVTLKNYGQNNLTSCQIKYQVTGGTVQTYNWSGNLSTNATTNVTLNTLQAISGSNTFTAYTDNPNSASDQNTSNDSKSFIFDAIVGTNPPILQTFQNATFPPTNYQISNADGNISWERTTAAGSASSASMFIDNYDYNNPGAYDWFVLPSVDLSSGNATLSYDYAYTYYSGTNTYYDSLAIAYSIDCGDSWYALYFEGGTQLATVPAIDTEFEPTANDWENNVIDLNIPALSGQSNVLLAFVGINGYGNNLYVDNINVQIGTTSPSPIADFSTSTTSVCAGQTVNFSNLTTQNPSSFSWSFPGGTPSSSSDVNPVITYNNPGTYNVTLTATNASGSDTETKTAYITVNANPSVNLVPTPATCNGINNGSITANVNGGAAPYNYEWSTVISNTPTISNLAPGPYTVTVVDDNNCSTTVSTTVGATSSISITLIPTDSTLLGGMSSVESIVSGGTPPYNYAWSNGMSSPSITNLSTGVYTLTITDINGCTATSSVSIGNVSIQDVEWLSSASIYPNPTNQSVHLDLSLSSSQDITVSVLNTLGQRLNQVELKNFKEGVQTFEVEHYTDGVYFIQIANSTGAKIYKFVKH